MDSHKIINETKEIQKQTLELMDSFRSAFLWLIRYCDKNNIPLPDMDKFIELTKNAGLCLEKYEFYQPNVNTNNNSREDNSTIFWVLFDSWDIFSVFDVGTSNMSYFRFDTFIVCPF